MTSRHLVLFSFVGGLLAGGWAPAAALAVVAAVALAEPRRAVAAAACLAVLAGAGIGHARREAVDAGRTPVRVGGVARGEVVLLERFRVRASGDRVAPAQWRGGWANGQRLLLRVRKTAEPPPSAAPGAVLAVAGRIQPLADHDRLQRRRGAAARLDVWRLVVTGANRGGLAGALDGVRSRGERGLSAGLPRPDAALLRGIVLGQDEAIAPEMRVAFQDSGLAHLLAVSGTNVMLLATLVLALGALLGLPLRWRLTAALVLVSLYVPLAGAGPSIQRAGVMGAAGLVAALAGRPASRWYALGLAAAVTLALNPYAAAEPGWQLSFAAVAGLLALAPAVRKWLERRGAHPLLAEAAALTGVATLATAPLLALHFDRVSLVSLPANLLVAPAVAPIMWLGTVAAAVGQVTAEAALPFNVINAGLLAFLAWVARVCAGLPFASVGVPPTVVLAIYGTFALAVLALRRGWLRLPRAPARGGPLLLGGVAAVSLLALVLGVGGGVAPPRPGETIVSFLDVGQGDATLIQRDGASLLVDTGPPDGPVVQRLQEAGVRRLDVLLVTHAQADHEGAAPQIIERFRPRVVLNGGVGWPTAVQRKLGRAVTPVAGQVLRLGPLTLEVLWPPRRIMESPPEGDPNDRAVVAHVRSGGFDLLLPADAESSVTAPLRLPRVEALKVAHHGSEDPGLPALLARLRPAVAAIEVGRGNPYGHPRPSTLAALRAVPQTYRTDRDGTVRLRVMGDRMSVQRERGLR